MADIFPLFVSYQQVAVFNSNLDSPFNDWGPRHVSQGFSWRSESVSFRIPDGEMCMIEVLRDAESPTLGGVSTREILTPFELIEDNSVIIGSITDENNISILERGKYQVIFELLPGGTNELHKFDHGIRFRFVKKDDAVFEIRKADQEMDTSSPLDLHAQAAQ
ncbi:hypothetical protein FHX14_005920 [Rhizobium sp. BK619]|uniref:competence protein ComJ n=1 Tax=Rhizobium sp. BK619 TaxID=2586989 RepID=UPI001611C947|nr:competence protein ComJ [Rhizobium sp. BK619]MBB3649679.1 hypothetical protein [Rhizobium sp. BK619]